MQEPAEPLQPGAGLSLTHARPIGDSGPPFQTFGSGSSGSPPMITGLQGCSLITGGAIVIDRTQGTPLHVKPKGMALSPVQLPSHPTGGSKFVLTPPPGHAALLTVHFSGKVQAPSGSAQEHVPHFGGGGAAAPSNATIGASAGQAGGSTPQRETNATAFQPSGGEGTQTPPAHRPDMPASPASSPASEHFGGSGSGPSHAFAQSQGIGFGPSGHASGHGHGQHRGGVSGRQSEPGSAGDMAHAGPMSPAPPTAAAKTIPTRQSPRIWHDVTANASDRTRYATNRRQRVSGEFAPNRATSGDGGETDPSVPRTGVARFPPRSPLQ